MEANIFTQENRDSAQRRVPPMTTRGSLKKPDTGDYSHLEPLPDPPREPDMQQRRRTAAFDAILMAHFAHRNDVLISGDGYLRRDPANEDEPVRRPTAWWPFGVNPDAIVSRNGYVISEVGKPPDFVLEVASRSTGRRDHTVKRTGYAGYGVQEYWRFDHTDGRYHDTALAGDVLTDAEYTPALITREPDAWYGHSSVLDLDLCWDRGELRLRDPRTGQFLPTPDELQSAKEAAEERADTERVAKEAAEERADTERVAKEAAEERADAERGSQGSCRGPSGRVGIQATSATRRMTPN